MGGRAMSFSRPELLAAIPVLSALLYLLLVLHRRRLSRLADAYGEDAAGRLLPFDVKRFPRERLACLLIAGLAICLVAAGPGETPNQDLRSATPVDIAIMVDASLSMAATDVAPTRMQRARDVVAQLTEVAPKGRLSLVLIGDWPYTLVPPTDDPELLAYFGRSLTEALISNLASSVRTATGDQGASLQDAIAHARAALGPRPATDRKRVVLLITDGAVTGDRDGIRAAAEAASAEDVAIWVAGVGRSAGARLELGDGRAFDASGNLRTGGFDEPLLRSIARAGGGVYENVSNDRGARALISGLRGLGGVTGPDEVVPERIAFWLLILAIALLALEGGLDAGRLRLSGRAMKDPA